MVAPAITSITPATGHSLGLTFVRIVGTNFNDEASGGTVNVLFGGVQATEIKLISATLIHCLTPGGDIQAVDVIVQNITPNPPGADIVEFDTSTLGFEYQRPDISTPADLSNYSTLTNITRKLVSDFRRTILAATFHDAHPDYADSDSAALNIEKQTSVPHIKIVGPRIADDREYPLNQQTEIEKAGDLYDIIADPVIVRLEYNFLCVAKTTGEVDNLLIAVFKYFKYTPFLNVFKNGVDDTEGIAKHEMDIIPEDRGTATSRATRQGVYQYRGSFELRGVCLLDIVLGENHKVTEDPEQEFYSF